MIGGLAILLICQLAGEFIAALLHLPVPGPVIGMILLFCGLLIGDLRPQASRATTHSLETAAEGLLRHLALMFVPAGTGVIAYVALIRKEWLAITIALIGSTLLAIVVTGSVMQALTKHSREPVAKEETG